MFAVLLLKAQWASKVGRKSNIPVGLVTLYAGDYCKGSTVCWQVKPIILDVRRVMFPLVAVPLVFVAVMEYCLGCCRRICTSAMPIPPLG